MSTESIHDFAVKLAVDATGVATGMKAATAMVLQAQRDQAKADQIEREINLQQKIDTEEKFSKWYMSELDREFQAWYKVELQKETAAEEAAAERTRIAAEAAATQQQIMINTYNAAISNERRLTDTIEEETQKQLAFSRQLQEAVIARYAAQDAAEEAAVNKADTETQAIMDDAWTRIVEQQRRTLAKFYADKAKMEQQSRDEAARLRDEEAALILATTQREHANLQRANEEEFEDLKQAIIRRNNERLRLEEEYQIRYRSAVKRAQREQADADRFRAGARTDMPAAMTATNISPATLRMVREFVAEETRANNLREDAVALIRQLATAQDLHNERVAEYNRMLAIGALNQDQYNAAIARSTQIMNANAGGFGGAGAAITQASYAAEDFIQVLSMGGGLNMALMSASNNLSMVARSVLGANAAMGALAGFGVPALLIGLGMLVRYMTDTESATDKATEALERFRKETEHIGEMTRLRFKFEDEAQAIQEMQTREEVEQKITELKQDQARLDAVMAQEEMKRAGANSAYFEGLMGGQEAVLDFQARLNKMIEDGTEVQKVAARELAAQYAAAREAAIAGNEQVMFDRLRNMHDIMTSNVGGFEDYFMSSNQVMDVSAWDNLKGKITDPDLLNALQEIYQPNITNMQENLELQQKIAEELISQQEHMTEERKRQLEIANQLLLAQQRGLEIEGMQTRERQQRMREELDYMRMSEAEREMKRLRDEQAAFAGIDTAFVGPQLPISEEAFLQEFVNLQLEQVQKEIEQLRRPNFASGMEQNAFDAQAKAFEQMFKSQFERNPQLERLDQMLEVERRMLDAIENNGFVVVP